MEWSGTDEMRLRPPGGADGGPDPRDLPEMQEVVTGVEPDHPADALLAALRVHAHTPEVVGRGAAEQPEVHRPEDAELEQRLGRVRPVVVQAGRPAILVVAGERWPILREHEPQPPGPHHLGIGQVLQHVPDRPFPFGFRLRELPRRQPLDGPLERRDGLIEHGKRIARAEQRQHRVGVAGRLRAGAPRGIRED